MINIDESATDDEMLDVVKHWTIARGWWNKHNGSDLLLMQPWSMRPHDGMVQIYTSKHAGEGRTVEGWRVQPAVALAWALTTETAPHLARRLLDAVPRRVDTQTPWFRYGARPVIDGVELGDAATRDELLVHTDQLQAEGDFVVALPLTWALRWSTRDDDRTGTRYACVLLSWFTTSREKLTALRQSFALRIDDEDVYYDVGQLSDSRPHELSTSGAVLYPLEFQVYPVNDNGRCMVNARAEIIGRLRSRQQVRQVWLVTHEQALALLHRSKASLRQVVDYTMPQLAEVQATRSIS